MPKDNKQKIKLLYLMEVLRQETDEQHPMSTNQICKRLGEQGISCERRTVGMDMKVLNDYGYEIMSKMVGHEKAYYMASDLRPVFPEERLLLAILEGKEASHFMDKSVWAANSRYYIDGKPLSIPPKAFAEANTDQIAEQVSAFSDCIDYASFDQNIAAFISANQHRLAYLKDEAFSFVRKAAERFKEESCKYGSFLKLSTFMRV